MLLPRIVLFSGCLLLGFAKTGYAQNLSLEVYNLSGYDLDSLYIEKEYVGGLKRDSTIIIRQIDTLTIQGMLPLLLPVGVVKEKKMHRSPLKCSTKSRKVSDGHYRFNLHSREDQRGLSFYWTVHQ